MPRSLIGRALAHLSRREHSRVELERKLAPHAESAQQLAATLDELERRELLSVRRFTESLVHRRAPRFGARRIEHELGQHDVDPALTANVLDGLRQTERERALQVWCKRFGESAANASERARQQRFMAQRGFDGDTIRWVLKRAGQPVPPGDPESPQDED